MYRPILVFFFLGKIMAVAAQEAPVEPIGRPNPNKIIEILENVANVRGIYRDARVKLVKEYFQPTTSEPKILACRTWLDEQGRPTRKAFYEGRDSVDVTDYAYHPSGLLASTVNRTYGEFADVFRTEYTYDEKGRLLLVKGVQLTKNALGEQSAPKTEAYSYDDATGQIVSVLRSGREREAYVFSVDSASGKVFKACYRLAEGATTPAFEQDPYGYYVFTFDTDGEIYINEYFDEGQLAFHGEYVYRGPGQFMATKNRELPHKAIRSNYSYDPRGLLLQIQSTDGSLASFEYEFYK